MIPQLFVRMRIGIEAAQLLRYNSRIKDGAKA
jgi:hypothetical protein